MSTTNSALSANGTTTFTSSGTTTASAKMLERGKRSIAGGDSSTMRVLPYHIPLVAERGEGSRLWDIDGNEYIDLNMAYGPLLFGHRPKHVIDAVTRQISEFGSQLGFPTEITIRVAEKIKHAVSPAWSCCGLPIRAPRRVHRPCGWRAPSPAGES